MDAVDMGFFGWVFLFSKKLFTLFVFWRIVKAPNFWQNRLKIKKIIFLFFLHFEKNVKIVYNPNLS